MTDLFKKKYLKYKSKYIKLKSLINSEKYNMNNNSEKYNMNNNSLIISEKHNIKGGGINNELKKLNVPYNIQKPSDYQGCSFCCSFSKYDTIYNYLD